MMGRIHVLQSVSKQQTKKSQLIDNICENLPRKPKWHFPLAFIPDNDEAQQQMSLHVKWIIALNYYFFIYLLHLKAPYSQRTQAI